MKNPKRKIIGGVVISVCVLCAAAAGSKADNRKSEDSVTVSALPAEKTPIIVLDAGHGGADGGCSSAEGVPEKGINLNILLKLRDILLLNGYEVEVTRDTDISIHDSGIEGLANQKSSDMDNRLAVFNKYDNALCLSIHQNQFTQPQYRGAQMFYSATNPASEALARSLQGSFRTLLQPDNDREIKQCGKELFLCYFSENPTVMAECGFLSNPDEAAMLNTDEYQTKIALTLFSGISTYISGID
ncbi:N-acetylmuramoyl-L-alanine amidase [uncultured Ruminococcus sp.]|uniref:N-acetylmuramoyl-L-alanine amidase n=1 Tax=uncultured Ruminococcus sp. TaxID=165186 RepID=UPI002625944C|nr:N-acetylmuramoyl-L-alanine amidase [uncultured Ruminococcus sp.]